MDMNQIIREQARLIILKSLAEQVDERLNSDLLVEMLKPFGIRKDRAWVHEELKYLQDMGAVTVLVAGTVQVATLTDKGHRHLEREIAIEGVKRPSRPVS
ncbi:MAG: hypothetical protein ACK4TM_06355 [Yoonia sp.]